MTCPERNPRHGRISQSCITKTVEELMTRVTSVDFVQPWYRCVATNMGNTGMALGGIGTAVTGTPAGTTPCFHFFNGCGIENEEGRTIELTNYFYGEVLSDDLTLLIRSMSFFQEDVAAFPLFDSHGQEYFQGHESQEQSLRILKRIISTRDLRRRQPRKPHPVGTHRCRKERHSAPRAPG